MTIVWFILLATLYLAACRLTLSRLRGVWRELIFTTLNVVGYYWFFVYGRNDHRTLILTIVYLLIVLLQYFALLAFSESKKWRPWIAFFVPLMVLFVVKYVPVSFYAACSGSLHNRLLKEPDFTFAPYFIGLSYLAFRTSRLVLEIRNGLVQRPSFLEYLGFCFFVPTMPVGPINTYANYRRGFETVPYEIPMSHAAGRIVVGLVKFKFLAGLLNQLSYSGLLLDGYYHHWIDLPVAMLFFYLYLYCNFSGFCDLAIGAAALIGIPVPENFNNPFAARNVKDFWNRWHITLSTWMRDVVFSPLSKFLVHIMGVRLADHAIALTIAIVFLLVGVWHGVGWNFAVLGLIHAFGVVTNHYYTIFLKRKLGRERFKAYNENPWIRAVAVALTFCYCGASMIFFANTLPQIKDILESVR